MSRIKLNDLPQDAQISKEEMKKVFGGMTKANRLENTRLINVKSGLAMPGDLVSAAVCCCDDDCNIAITGIRTNVISQR